MVIAATIERIQNYIADHSSKADFENGILGVADVMLIDGYRFREPSEDEDAEHRLIGFRDDGTCYGCLVDGEGIDCSSRYHKYVEFFKGFNLGDCEYLNIWDEDKVYATYNNKSFILRII